jgi:hypothetical protein
MTLLLRTLICALLLISLPASAQAAMLYGTVTGPDGPVAGAKVIAQNPNQETWETTTDAQGNYSFTVPDGTYGSIRAEMADGDDGFFGEGVSWLNVSGEVEIRLFMDVSVAIDGAIELPGGFEGDSQLHVGRMDIPYAYSVDWRHPGNEEFSATGIAGAYFFHLWAGCQESEFLGRGICNFADYFSSATVDVRDGKGTQVVIPTAVAGAPHIPMDPPRASLISVAPPDAGGIALVSGAPGAATGVSWIRILNLNTGHYVDGASRSDGSFDIRFLAPPGSWLEVRQDPTAHSQGGEQSAGTLIRVPYGNPAQNYATLGSACEWCKSVPDSPAPVRNVGVQDWGQVSVSGNLEGRQWSAGDVVPLSGVVKLYTRNAAKIDPGSLRFYGRIVLERVFDPDGRQEFTNPVFVSQNMTPTGLPIERKGGNRGSSAGVWVAEEFIFDDWSEMEGRGFSSTWTTTVNIPPDLPEGRYSMVIEVFEEENRAQLHDLHFEDAFKQIFDTPFTRSHATMIEVGAPAPGRLSWVLGINDFSNGARGTVAIEDRDRIGVAGRVTTNSKPFIVPMIDERNGIARQYRLEPFAPLLGASNRGWISPPPIEFDFPSGALTVSIENPDGSITNIAPEPFAQSYVQSAQSLSGNGLSGVSNDPHQYFGLTTLNPKFDVTFDQYGLHRVTMTGHIDDVLGNRYEGGGTYEIYIARHLDLETGVFANTPFEVGDSVSPTVIVQPGVPAEVEITVSHFPQSDPDQRVTHVIQGTANRFGYFHPVTGESFSFTEPGEYRFDVVAHFEDQEGVLWMGAESWASIVETPNDTLVAHGLRVRGRDGTRQQWVIGESDNIGGGHLPFPYQTGDIAWSLDTDYDPDFIAMFPGLSVQDTQGDFVDLLKPRQQARHDWHHGQWDENATTGEILLFSSTPTEMPAVFHPDAPETHWGYFYSGAARPGVRVRDMVSEDENQESYWRFDDTYNYQPGNGVNGDLPNDFKFQFGGTVYRGPDADFYHYGAYGSLWVMLPHDDPDGIRVMPPFQGNGGGPSGGPIMTLKGKDIDLFFHPTGLRPGSILEVGDKASIAGQFGPTLGSHLEVVITPPSGPSFKITGQASKIGYFYDPEQDFVVEAPGVYKATVKAWYTGRTSAGQVQQPYPKGNVLGSRSGEFYFYVVKPNSQPLSAELPSRQFVEPGKESVPVDLLVTDDIDNPTLYYTTVMPGFILEEGTNKSLSYAYDAQSLNKSFPNIDLEDDDFRFGVDTITMSFLVSGEDGNGDPVFRARQVLLQGEELMAPAQQPTAGGMDINVGHAGAWFYPTTSGQGQFIDIEPASNFMFIGWFTYTLPDSDHPNEQQWFTAQGNYSGDMATLDLHETTGGKFDDPQGVTTKKVGTVTLKFDDCENGLMTYQFEDGRPDGSFPLERVIPGSGNLCEEKSGSVVQAIDINRGLDGAWFNPDTSGQGYYFDVHREESGEGFIFLSWFTYGDDTESGQRWLTAQGNFSGSTAEIDVHETTGGSFDDPKVAETLKVGTMTIDFEDCNNATLSYSIDDGVEGGFGITRVVPGGESLCEELSSAE